MSARMHAPQSLAPGLQSRLWRRYVAGGRRNEKLRNHLLSEHLAKLNRLATAMAGQLAGEDYDELLQAGWQAMVDAAAWFEPRFQNFWIVAYPEVLAAMVERAPRVRPRRAA